MTRKSFERVDELAQEVARRPELAAEIKKDPAAALQQLAATPPVNDVWIYRLVVIALGLALLICVVAASLLAGYGKVIPELLVAIGSAAVGALTGLLAPSPIR